MSGRARCERAHPAGSRDVTWRGGHPDAQGAMPRDREAPTVVIIHGAWVDGTSWREVIALLHVKGLSVIAVQNPLSALADDVDAAARVIKRQPGPVVLVGHGYGGTVITQAGDRRDDGATGTRGPCRRKMGSLFPSAVPATLPSRTLARWFRRRGRL